MGPCGYHGAWRRIAARGLTHQAKTVTDHPTGAMVICTVGDKLETRAVITSGTNKTSRDRSKTRPTRYRTTRPAPRRRRAPSQRSLHRPVVQCPEGHAHKDSAPGCPAQRTGAGA